MRAPIQASTAVSAVSSLAPAASAEALATARVSCCCSAIKSWIGARIGQVESLRASVDEIETSGTGWTFAKLTIANGAIREVLGS